MVVRVAVAVAATVVVVAAAAVAVAVVVVVAAAGPASSRRAPHARTARLCYTWARRHTTRAEARRPQ